MDKDFHDIDPRMKDERWALSYIKEVYGSGSKPGAWFGRTPDRYRTLRQYATGKQTVEQYKNRTNEGQSLNSDIDWTPLPIITRLRDQAITIAKKIDYDVTATPIDPMSSDESNKYFAALEAKIRLRQELSKVAPMAVENSPVAQSMGEPADIDELMIMKSTTFKHGLSLQIEQMIQTVFNLENMDEHRNMVKQDIFDFGIGGYKEFVRPNGTVGVRRVDPSRFVSSKVRRRDFSDATWMAECYDFTIGEFMQLNGSKIGESQLEEIKRCARSKSRDIVSVVDFEFISYNRMDFVYSVDKYGNTHFSRTKPGTGTTSKFIQVVYRGKWVEGTDVIIDFGLVNNMKRDRANLSETEMSFHMFAPGLDPDSNIIVSKLEHCIGTIDQMNLAYYKMQSSLANAIPKGNQINVAALQDLPVGSNGKRMTAKDVISHYYNTGDILFTHVSYDGQMTNFTPVTPIENGVGAEVQTYMMIIDKCVQTLRDIIGLNEATDSFTGSRTYSAAVGAGQQATNNALYFMIESDRQLLQSLSTAIVLRLQSLDRSGNLHKVYRQSIGEATVGTLKSNVALHAAEFGIILDVLPSDESRALFMERMQRFVDAGQLDISDMIMLEGMRSIKNAMAIMAYKITAKRKRDQEEAMAMQQMNAKVQQESAMASESAKLQREMQLKNADLEIEKIKGQLRLAAEEKKREAMVAVATINAGKDTQVAEAKAESDEYIAELLVDVKKQRSAGQVTGDLIQ